MRTTLTLALLWTVGCKEEVPAEKAQLETFNVRMENVSAPGAVSTSTGDLVDVKFAPGVLVLHDSRFQLFEAGQAILFPGFEDLVEDGNNAPLIAELEGMEGVFVAKSFAALDESYKSAPMAPGEFAILTEYATYQDVDRLSLVAMYGESNDTFIGTPPGGIELFDGNEPAYDEIAASLSFWDGGTEVNEEPGVGANQPARQSAPGQGVDENGVVVEIVGADVGGWAYPTASEWASVEVYGE